MFRTEYMIIKVERSGGFAGIASSNEIETNTLPDVIVTTVNRIKKDQGSFSSLLHSSPKGSADYFTYKITIQDGPKKSIIECNQLNVPDNLRSLIRYVETNSKKE